MVYRVYKEIMMKKIICTLAAVDIDENVVEEGGLHAQTDKRNLFCPTIVASVKEFNKIVDNFLRSIEED
jgi:hypothetical protein